jgi:hypothetical protein
MEDLKIGTVGEDAGGSDKGELPPKNGDPETVRSNSDSCRCYSRWRLEAASARGGVGSHRDASRRLTPNEILRLELTIILLMIFYYEKL